MNVLFTVEYRQIGHISIWWMSMNLSTNIPYIPNIPNIPNINYYYNKISHIMKSVKYLFFDDFWSLISPLNVVLFESNIFAFWSSSNGTSLVSFIVGPRDPRTAWFAHRSVRVCAIFFGFYLVDAGFRRFSGFDALWSEFLGNFVVQFLWILCYVFIAHLMAVLFRHIYYDSQRCVGFTGFIALFVVMKIGKIETGLESWSVHMDRSLRSGPDQTGLSDRRSVIGDHHILCHEKFACNPKFWSREPHFCI